MELIKAKPLIEQALSFQIREAGGRGFNVDVECEPVQGTFSVIHTFATPSGKKSLITRNEICLGLIAEEQNYFVYYHADNSKYTLATFEQLDNGQRDVSYEYIGCTFKDAMESLKSKWPKRLVWNIQSPYHA